MGGERGKKGNVRKSASEMCLCSCGVRVVRCHMNLGRRVSIVNNVSVCGFMCKRVSGGGERGVSVNLFKNFIVIFHVVVRVLVVVHDIVLY